MILVFDGKKLKAKRMTNQRRLARKKAFKAEGERLMKLGEIKAAK